VLQDKRSDLDAEKRKQVLDRMIRELSAADPDFYYRATSEVALSLEQRIARGEGLNAEERTLLAPLSRRDIQVLLSHH
jgi:hypothetical protein